MKKKSKPIIYILESGDKWRRTINVMERVHGTTRGIDGFVLYSIVWKWHYKDKYDWGSCDGIELIETGEVALTGDIVIIYPDTKQIKIYKAR